MAVLRGVSASLVPWTEYVYGLGALSTLFVPRAARWSQRWVRARMDERLVLARAVGATTQVS